MTPKGVSKNFDAFVLESLGELSESFQQNGFDVYTAKKIKDGQWTFTVIGKESSSEALLSTTYIFEWNDNRLIFHVLYEDYSRGSWEIGEVHPERTGDDPILETLHEADVVNLLRRLKSRSVFKSLMEVVNGKPLHRERIRGVLDWMPVGDLSDFVVDVREAPDSYPWQVLAKSTFHITAEVTVPDYFWINPDLASEWLSRFQWTIEKMKRWPISGIDASYDYAVDDRDRDPDDPGIMRFSVVVPGAWVAENHPGFLYNILCGVKRYINIKDKNGNIEGSEITGLHIFAEKGELGQIEWQGRGPLAVHPKGRIGD